MTGTSYDIGLLNPEDNLLPYPLAQINADVFQELCDQGASESSTVDFKQTLPGRTDDDKEELAKDVSAMLNAGGGDLVYGIAEDRATGNAKQIHALEIDNFDKESRRITQVLDGWIEPRAHGIQIHQVPLPTGCGMVIRIPMSFDGPHWIRNPNSTKRRFVIRNGKMTSDMSFDQVRTAFNSTSSLPVKAREFIRERLQLIEEKRLPMPMVDEPLAVLEVVPLSGLTRRKPIDVRKFDFVDLITWGAGGDPKINLDGVGAYLSFGECAGAQSQFFRNGAMEFIVRAGMTQEGRKEVWADHTMEFFENSLKASLKISEKTGIAGPALVTCALMHVKDHSIAALNPWGFKRTSDRPFLVLPEIYVDDLSVAIDTKELLDDTRHVLHQAFGSNSAPG